MKRFLTVVLSILLLMGLAIFALGRSHLNSFIEQRLVRLAGDNGIILSLDDFSLGFGSPSAKNVSVRFSNGRLPLAFLIDTLALSPKYFSLFSNIAAGHLEATSYEGSILIDSSMPTSGGDPSVKLEIENLNLVKHPQIAGLGISSGVLTLNTSALQFRPHPLPLGTARLELEKLGIPRKIQLHPQLTGLPLPLTLPAIHDGTLTLDAKVEGDTLEIANFDFTSSWGECTGDGTLAIDRTGRVQGADLEFDIHLSDVGNKEFASYFLLLGKNRLPPGTRSVHLTIQAPPFRSDVQAINK